MTIINHECYISLEIAKLLKEAGFDWKLNSRWQDWGGKNPHEFILKTDLLYADGPAEYDGFHALPSPTLDVAQRWLREVKNVDVFAYRNEPKDKFESIVSVNKKWSTTGMCINTYEEALETAIKKALEMILEKGE